MRILIVEDDFISRRLLCRYLAPFGEADVAVNGGEALQAVRHALDDQRPYDLICLDIMMPDMDGHETLCQIREMEHEKGISKDAGMRIIMTTALEDDSSVVRAFQSQCDGYVVKPIEKKRFLKSLEKIGLPVGIVPETPA